MQVRFHRNIAASSLAADCNVPQRPPAIIRSFTSIQMAHTHNFVTHTHNFVTYTHNFVQHNIATQDCHTHTHTRNFLTHNFVTHSFVTHTHNFVTHNFVTPTLSHTQLAHTQHCHTLSFRTQLCDTQHCHTHTHRQLAHTHKFVTHHLSHTTSSHTTLSHTTLSHTTLSHTINLRSAWQAWHLWHWAASGGALGPRWSPGAPRHFAWQAWHLATAACVSRGRRGTYGHPRSICVAGVALMALGWIWWGELRWEGARRKRRQGGRTGNREK